MKRHTILLVALAIIVGFVAFWVFGTNKAAAPKESGSSVSTPGASGSQNSVNTASPDTASSSCAPVAENATITYSGGTFTPSCITVKPGSKISFVNPGDQEIQIGSDPHPSHTGNREVSNGKYTMTVPAGSQASTTLTTPGTHSFHNHLNPAATGRIIVK